MAQTVVKPSSTELVAHTLVIVTVIICSTFLGIHGDFNSGDLLAVFSAAITGTAAVAGARANRRTREEDHGGE